MKQSTTKANNTFRGYFKIISRWFVYWFFVAFISFGITLILLWVIAEYFEHIFSPVDITDRVNEKDLGLGVIMVGYFFRFIIVGYSLLWPMTFWLTHKLLKNLKQNIF